MVLAYSLYNYLICKGQMICVIVIKVYLIVSYNNTKITMQQHQIINSVLNLDTLFEQLTKLRFKGRQLI